MVMLSNMRFTRIHPITQLPTRQQFIADYVSAPAAQLVLMTLSESNHFNQLMRAIGHEYTEDFMRVGAARLRESVPGDIPIYHVGLLGFAFVLPGGACPESLQKIVDHFDKALNCGGIPVVTDIALGIADCTDSNASNVLRAALAAAQDCRDSGAAWAFYDRKLDTASQRGFVLLSQLSAAMLAGDQLSLHFQPIYALANGMPTGAEALLRWQHPVFGAVSPAEFVPLVEATAHIHPLTDWVLRNAFAQASTWAAQGLNLNIAVNVSPKNLLRRGFSVRIAELLKGYDVNPSSIELEFTEGVLVGNDYVVLEELQALRDTGIRIALDDFGTGFANFKYITHLPADILKIDKFFIQKIGTDERSALVVRTLIELAHRLDYSVIAEGVETERAYRLLAGWDCDEGQGFFMSPPLDAARFAEKIRGKIPVAAPSIAL